MASVTTTGARRGAHRDGGRDQEGLPAAGDEIPPGPQSQRSRRGGPFKEVKGGLRGLSDAQKRPTYWTSSATRRRASRGAGQGLRSRERLGDIFGEVFGDIFGGGRRNAPGVSRRRPDAMSSRSISRRPFSAPRRTSSLRRWRECGEARDQGSTQGLEARECETCRGAGQVRMQQGSSPCNRPARAARAGPGDHRPMRRLPRSAGASDVRRRSRSRCRPASTTANASPHGEGGPGGTAARGRTLRSRSGPRAQDFERDGSQPVLRGDDEHCNCLAGRRDRSADARWQRDDQGSAGDAVGSVFRLREKGSRRVRGRPHGDLFGRGSSRRRPV